MSLTIKEINYDNLDDLKKLESALKNWFANPKELNFTDPHLQYPFDMKKWININYKLNNDVAVYIRPLTKGQYYEAQEVFMERDL